MSARTNILAVLAALLPASAAHAQDAYRYGYIRTVEQGVTLQRASEAAAEVASPNAPFLPGDRVWTDDAGRMEVLFADGSVLRLDSRSKLDYVSQDGGRRERAVLRLWSGALILHTRDQKRSPDFIVESPEGVLEPNERGVYRLDVQPGEARVAVFDGEAAVEANRRVRVSRGQQLIVREGEPYAGPEPISGADADDTFARWDRDLEEQLAYADGRRPEYLPEEVAPYASDFDTYGSWRVEGDYGSVWYPRVNVGWAPYSHGHWAWTAYGWTWIPTERWGWATSHYGRWGYNDGWFWIPGRSWGAAWVNWSAGGDYVGWCPLGWGDRPVYLPAPRVKGHAVRRGPVQADTVPWTYVRRGDMGLRDLARRRVDPTQVATGELRVAPAGQARLSRDLRLVEGSGLVSTGQPAAGGAVPRNVQLKHTPGDTVPELQADPKTTIRRPIPRRHREPEETADESGGDGQQGQSGSRVGVPKAPRSSAPFLVPDSTAPRQQRSNGEGQVSTGQQGEPSTARPRDVQRLRPRAEDGEATRGEAAQDRGERDREILRPIFGPLSRQRSDDGASQDRGSSSRDGGAQRTRPSSDGERSRPSGASSAPKTSAPPTAQPPAQPQAQPQAQPRERAKPRDQN
jgi:uncharacterized protein DUF6600/FecR-like protein